MPDVTMTSNASSPVTIKLLQSYVSEQLNRSWPIGSIFITVSNINPANSIGGKWKRIAEGRCLVGVGTSQNTDIKLRQTGGAWSTQLTTAQLPAHNHHIGGSINTNEAGSHNHKLQKRGGMEVDRNGSEMPDTAIDVGDNRPYNNGQKMPAIIAIV